MRSGISAVLWVAMISCAGGHAQPVPPVAPRAHLSQASLTIAASSPPAAELPPAPKDELLDWALANLPPGGKAERNDAGALVVTHEASAKDTAYSIAKSYLALTETYLAVDLAKAISPIKPGKTVTIPNLVSAVPKSPAEDRLAWPEDRALRGIYLGGRDALGSWEDTLKKLEARGMNAVILDGKAYMGDVTYASKVQVAIDTRAIKDAPIPDLSRAIRFAHKHGVRVSMRIACFHDPLAAEKAPALSIKGYWGGPYPIGWLDPGGDEAQQYIEDLVKESLDLGADEINLDYVRYPVQNGLGNADFHLKEKGMNKKEVIKAFAHRIHEITKAKHVPLSVDIFGVTATGIQADIDALGQDIGMLGPEVEALMPMVYPSHYDKGFYGWAEPGNHPEIVAIGTKAAVEKLDKAQVASAVIRPWLQAFMWRSPEYGPRYLAQETVEAGKGGGVGWVMWNPGGSYWDAWNALPPKGK
jgi:hypothetical protein